MESLLEYFEIDTSKGIYSLQSLQLEIENANKLARKLEGHIVQFTICQMANLPALLVVLIHYPATEKEPG